MEWIRVIDELPVIPEGKYGVSIIGATFDPCFCDVCREHGNFSGGYSINRYITYKVMEEYSSEPDFYEPLNDDTWIPTCDIITHWTYLPKRPEFDAEVLNPIFKRYHENARPTPPLFKVENGIIIKDENEIFER